MQGLGQVEQEQQGQQSQLKSTLRQEKVQNTWTSNRLLKPQKKQAPNSNQQKPISKQRVSDSRGQTNANLSSILNRYINRGKIESSTTNYTIVNHSKLSEKQSLTNHSFLKNHLARLLHDKQEHTKRIESGIESRQRNQNSKGVDLGNGSSSNNCPENLAQIEDGKQRKQVNLRQKIKTEHPLSTTLLHSKINKSLASKKELPGTRIVSSKVGKNPSSIFESQAAQNKSTVSTGMMNENDQRFAAQSGNQRYPSRQGKKWSPTLKMSRPAVVTNGRNLTSKLDQDVERQNSTIKSILEKYKVKASSRLKERPGSKPKNLLVLEGANHSKRDTEFNPGVKNQGQSPRQPSLLEQNEVSMIKKKNDVIQQPKMNILSEKQGLRFENQVLVQKIQEKQNAKTFLTNGVAATKLATNQPPKNVVEKVNTLEREENSKSNSPKNGGNPSLSTFQLKVFQKVSQAKLSSRKTQNADSILITERQNKAEGMKFSQYFSNKCLADNHSRILTDTQKRSDLINKKTSENLDEKPTSKQSESRDEQADVQRLKEKLDLTLYKKPVNSSEIKRGSKSSFWDRDERSAKIVRGREVDLSHNSGYVSTMRHSRVTRD